MAKKAPAKRRRPAKKRPTRSRLLTIQQMADGIGVSGTTIDKYVKRGCPRTSIAAVQKWRTENIKAVAEDADLSEIGIEIKRAEMAERWENARTRQQKNDERDKLLILRTKVLQMNGLVMSRLMNRLNSIPMACANIVPSEMKPTIKAMVEESIRVALKEFRNDFGRGY